MAVDFWNKNNTSFQIAYLICPVQPAVVTQQ